MIEDKLVFILGIHKSGTSYLRALLDNHPELSVLPFETHILELLGQQNRYPLRKNKLIKKEYFTALVKETMQKHMPNFGENVDVVLTENLINDIDWELPDKKLIINYWEVLLDFFYLPKSNIIVEKSVENVFYVTKLMNWFPNAQFIHITRPFAEHVKSLRKYFKPKFYSKGNYRYPYLVYKNIRQANWNEKNGNYHHVELARLKKYIELEMADIARFLNIRHTKNLFYPTTLGEPWISNTQKISIEQQRNYY
jgi:hypothetical protein